MIYDQLAFPLYNIGDVVYYIRGYNPKEGQVFDRLAIYKKVIKDILTYGFVASDGEIMLMGNKLFDNLEIAKERLNEIQGFIEIVESIR